MDAPLGTQAEVVMPLLSMAVTMTVGLPRESRISRAVILRILLMNLMRIRLRGGAGAEPANYLPEIDRRYTRTPHSFQTQSTAYPR